jgi:hypothetical protein
MQEFWFCSECRSMNRADARRCYKCRALKEQSTLATVAERNDGVVLTPGLDEEHREVAWALMSTNRYVSAWRLGYVAAGLICLFLVLAPLFFGAVVVALISIVRSQAADQPNTGLAAILLVLTLASTLVFMAMVVLHSVFLGLTAMNSPALGCGTPRFGPVRSGLWWIESYLWSTWGMLTLWFWPYLIARALGVLCGPIAAIGKPRRMLQDLMDRSGVPGSSGSRPVGVWSIAWVAARCINYVAYLLPLLLIISAFILYLFTGLVGIHLSPAPEGQLLFFSLILLAVILGGELLAEGSALFLLSRITIELSRRQRAREAWVRQGLAVARATAADSLAGATEIASGQAVYEHAQPQARVAPQAPTSPVRPVAPALTGFSTQPHQWVPQSNEPIQPALDPQAGRPSVAPSASPSVGASPKSWPGPILPLEFPSAGEVPRFDPRAWVPPRPVLTPPPVSSATTAPIDSVVPAPPDAPKPATAATPPAPDPEPGPADDTGWGEGL